MANFDIEAGYEALYATGALRARLAHDGPAALRLRDLSVSSEATTILCHWGCARRRLAGPAEENFLCLVTDVRNTLKAALGVSATLTFLFTDTHARINGIDPDLVAEYKQSVDPLVREAGGDILSMSEIVNSTPSIVAAPRLTGARWERIRAVLRSEAIRLFGAPGAEQRASEYERANLIESAATYRAFPTALFLHSGLPELRPLLPSLPIIYIFTGRPRINRKPWFRD